MYFGFFIHSETLQTQNLERYIIALSMTPTAVREEQGTFRRFSLFPYRYILRNNVQGDTPRPQPTTSTKAIEVVG